jgi:hypothetical protein
MKKALIAFAAAATVVAATVAVPSTADARCRGCGVAAGVFGGLVAGSIIGNAIANSRPYDYEPAPVYVAPPEGPGCHYSRQRVWDDYYGEWRRGPRVLVCP